MFGKKKEKREKKAEKRAARRERTKRRTEASWPLNDTFTPSNGDDD